ncbi:MAG: hypothetical protein AAGG50_05810 [Bacteroidota bacterium]
MATSQAADSQAPGPEPTARTWLGRGAWTVMDQALFAGSNFLLNVWLARTLTPTEYGIYTMVGYAGFLLATAIHTGFIIEPQLVFGAGRFKASARSYLHTLLFGHGFLSAGIAVAYVIAGGIALALGQPSMATACFVMAVAQAAIKTMWIMRRACYTQFRPFVAVTGGLLYLGMVVGILVLEHWIWGNLTVQMALGILGIASVVAALWIYVRLDLRDEEEPAPGYREEVRKQHTAYGRWAAPTGLMEMGHGLLPFLLIPIWGGLGAAGALRALYNLILPMIHVYGALCDLLMPSFVEAKANGRLRRTLAVAASALVGLSLLNWVFIGLYTDEMMLLLYGGQYLEYAHLSWLLGALPVIGTVVALLLALLRAMEMPRAVFKARAAAAVVAATIGAFLIYRYAVAGALASSQLALGTETVLMLAVAWGIWREADTPSSMPSEGDGEARAGEALRPDVPPTLVIPDTTDAASSAGTPESRS